MSLSTCSPAHAQLSLTSSFWFFLQLSTHMQRVAVWQCPLFIPCTNQNPKIPFLSPTQAKIPFPHKRPQHSLLWLLGMCLLFVFIWGRCRRQLWTLNAFPLLCLMVCIDLIFWGRSFVLEEDEVVIVQRRFTIGSFVWKGGILIFVLFWVKCPASTLIGKYKT